MGGGEHGDQQDQADPTKALMSRLTNAPDPATVGMSRVKMS